MTVRELCERLANHNPDQPVMILDSFNGGGVPREINLGPTEHVVKTSDAKYAADCEYLVGQSVVVLGFGCY